MVVNGERRCADCGAIIPPDYEKFNGKLMYRGLSDDHPVCCKCERKEREAKEAKAKAEKEARKKKGLSEEDGAGD
jgi:hypothetical protein